MNLPDPSVPIQPPPDVDPGSFAAFRGRVLELYKPPLRAKATYAKMRHALDDLATAAELTMAAELTTSAIAKFVTKRPDGQSANTTDSLLRSLRTACNFAVGFGFIPVSPFALRSQWVRPTKPRHKQHHSREEIACVLDFMRRDVEAKRGWPQWRARRLYALTALVAFTGLRKMEALLLRVEDIDRSLRMVFVVARSALKTALSEAPVPIPPPLDPILGDWLTHRLDAPPGVQYECDYAFPNVGRTNAWLGGSPGEKPVHRLKIVAARAGVEGVTFQSLRHSWATHSEYWGLSELMVKRVLRHASTKTQQGYRHPDPDNMRAATNRIDFGQAPGADLRGGPTP
jgi:integrase